MGQPQDKIPHEAEREVAPESWIHGRGGTYSKTFTKTATKIRLVARGA